MALVILGDGAGAVNRRSNSSFEIGFSKISNPSASNQSMILWHRSGRSAGKRLGGEARRGGPSTVPAPVKRYYARNGTTTLSVLLAGGLAQNSAHAFISWNLFCSTSLRA